MNAPRQPASRHEPSARDLHTPARVPGVIETIADGLSLVLAFPYLLLVPLAIDAGFWTGVTVSPDPLLRRWPDVQGFFEVLGVEANILPILALGVPSLLRSVDLGDAFTAWSTSQLSPQSWQWALATFALLGLASSLLAILFRFPLALVIRGEPRAPRTFARSVVLAWIRLIGVVAIVLGAIVLMVSPLIVVSAFFLVAGLNVAPLLIAALSIPAIAAAIYLTFTPDAIVLSEVGPFRAIYLSFNVVRRNFWPTLGFLGSSILISEGLGVLWRSLIGTPIGLLTGVLGNAFIGAGLGLAAMRFYSNRLDRWLATGTPEARRPSIP